MTIRATGIWTTRLDADGVPIGPKTNISDGWSKVFLDDEADEVRVGDWEGWSVTLDLSDISPVAMYLLTNDRRALGRSWPLKINGREYRRRRRNR